MFESSENDIDRWGIVKNWLEDNQSDVVLVVGIILVAIVSFGLGRLTAPKLTKEPIVIENEISNQESRISNNEADVLSIATPEGQSIHSEQSPEQTNNNVTDNSGKEGIIVASRNGTKYYWPWSSGVSKIKPENLIWFKSEREAKAAGYAPCSTFTKDAPAGYKL